MLGLFKRQNPDRHWIQTRNSHTKRWLLVCSKSEYRKRDQEFNCVAIGTACGCPKRRVVLAEICWSYYSLYWSILAVDDIDLLEELQWTQFLDEFYHVTEAFRPLTDESRRNFDCLRKNKTGGLW